MGLAPILAKSYIEQREAGYWVAGTRISLDSVVYSFLAGESSESIAQNFPLLSLEQVYGAFAQGMAVAKRLLPGEPGVCRCLLGSGRC